jgi:hypothetical protein
MKAFAACLALTAIALSGCAGMAGSAGTETSLRVLTDSITSAPPAKDAEQVADEAPQNSDAGVKADAEVISFDDDGQAFVATDEDAPDAAGDASAAAGEATASDEVEMPAPPDVEAPQASGEAYAEPLESEAVAERASEPVDADEADIVAPEEGTALEVPLTPIAIEAAPQPESSAPSSDAPSSAERSVPVISEGTAMEPAAPPPPPKFTAIEFDPPQRPHRLAQQPEEVQPPAPSGDARGGLEADADRINRTVCDVSIDIRPPAGAGGLPEDLAAEHLADQPTIDETFPSGQPADLFCSYTPWTICYRPLYFEDIPLERYGCNVGYLQTGLSGVKFFGSIAALPYKMTRRPPRSCQCSNGFSRCGDCPLPGYGNRRFQWDAALVETAIITGFVFILP